MEFNLGKKALLSLIMFAVFTSLTEKISIELVLPDRNSMFPSSFAENSFQSDAPFFIHHLELVEKCGFDIYEVGAINPNYQENNIMIKELSLD
uniref:hypothetical protein n=1 Tax=Roseivirga sp. TaxID=1964215 RepID=UPI0040480523